MMQTRSAMPGDKRTAAGSRAGERDRAPARRGRAGRAEGWSRQQFCHYLRERREGASLSIEEIARTTKIPERSLRRIEAGQFEELPGDVFVRGFLRSYARCVGLDSDDVVRKYAECGLEPSPVSSELAEVAAAQIAALAHADREGEGAVLRISPAPAPSDETGAEPRSVEGAAPVSEEAVVDDSGDSPGDDTRDDAADQSKARAITAAAPAARQTPRRGSRGRGSSRKRRRARGQRARSQETSQARKSTASSATPAPAARPATRQSPRRAATTSESAQDARATRRAARIARASARDSAPSAARPTRQRTFLPPVWSDSDSGARRGPLTLAVIILVIVATLAMSYLLRRPSDSGDGVTRAAAADRTPLV